MSSIIDQLKRRVEETRARVRSQIETVKARLGVPGGGILGGGKLLGNPSNPGGIIEQLRTRTQTMMTNIQSRIREVRERVLGGRLLGGGAGASKSTTDFVTKPAEKAPSKPARKGIIY